MVIPHECKRELERARGRIEKEILIVVKILCFLFYFSLFVFEQTNNSTK